MLSIKWKEVYPFYWQPPSQGFFNVQFDTKRAIQKIFVDQTKNMWIAQAYHLVAQGYKKVNNGKNGRFRYEMIIEMQP